jgi:putative hydrolase of the HAD superfamily
MNSILFDLGETLIHINPVLKKSIEEQRFQSIQEFFEPFGFNLNPNHIRSIFQNTLENILDTPEKEVRIRDVFEQFLKFSIQNSSLNLDRIEQIFYKAEFKAWSLFPDTIPCLDQASKANLELALVSNAKSDWAVREILKIFKLDKYFQVVVSSAQVGWRKPRPEPYLFALKHLRVKPKFAIFIGDTFFTDIVGAKRLGMKTVYLNRNEDQIPFFEGIIPDFTVRNLMEAMDIIEKIIH